MTTAQPVASDISPWHQLLQDACSDLPETDAHELWQSAETAFYPGMSEAEQLKAITLTARTRIEQEPQYSRVCARLVLFQLQGEALPFLGEPAAHRLRDLPSRYGAAFEAFIRRGIDLEHLEPAMANFDLAELAGALKPERDQQFDYLGLQTLYDRYFLHHGEIRYELPQVFFMRVAMGLALQENQPTRRAIEFYNLLSRFDFMASTPTLFNAGTRHSQLSSCYLTTVPDDLSGIYSAIRDNALLSKWAGGLGNDWTPVRSLGAHIKGTNGASQGIVPFLKVANDTAVAVNQGGKRKGAVCAYLETWHLDIEEFIELRKNTGDDRRRTHDMNTAHWIPDLFMERVLADEQWTLFSPSDVGDLHDLTGRAFRERYEAYEAMAQQGRLTHCKRVSAKQLWRRMLSMLFETGHPWLTFKDACNLRSPQQHAGVVHSSNLCTEITLNTSSDEIAVCNLGSVNLVAHLDSNGELDPEKLHRTVRTAVRMLDNVIDINYYAVPEAERSNQRHRPIGLGLMGFQDALYKAGLPYASDAAVDFADRTMEQLSYFALKASSDLAAERGRYGSYEGSLWSRGELPIDSIQSLAAQRSGGHLSQDTTATLDWSALRERIHRQGMRNSNVMAIAPTATIANIIGVSPSIEPTFQQLYVKANLSGDFTVVNPWLVKALKARGLWNAQTAALIKAQDGSIQGVPGIPDDIRALFRTAFETDPDWLVEAASRRQKWLDQSQSLNLYLAEASGPKVEALYLNAWKLGLKTTYYLRTRSASAVEKSTSDQSTLNAVPGSAPQCAIDDPDCDACQ